MSLYPDLFRALEEHGVRYLLAGESAMVLLGSARPAKDVILVLAMNDKNVGAFLSVARSLGLKPGVPVAMDALKSSVERNRWFEDKLMVTLPFIAPESTRSCIEVLLRHSLDFDAAFARAVPCRFHEHEVRVPSAEDMIVLKKASGRQSDRDDIVFLRELQNVPRETLTPVLPA